MAGHRVFVVRKGVVANSPSIVEKWESRVGLSIVLLTILMILPVFFTSFWEHVFFVGSETSRPFWYMAFGILLWLWAFSF